MLNAPFSASVWVPSSKIYMADLESALHYILRVEVGKFSVLEGQRLAALKRFMAVLAQVSRPRPPSSVRATPEGQWASQPGGVSPAPPSGAPGLAGHLAAQLSQSTMGCCPEPSAVPLPSATWPGSRHGVPGAAALGMSPADSVTGPACRGPPPWSEPGWWPLMPMDATVKGRSLF